MQSRYPRHRPSNASLIRRLFVLLEAQIAAMEERHGIAPPRPRPFDPEPPFEPENETYPRLDKPR